MLSYAKAALVLLIVAALALGVSCSDSKRTGTHDAGADSDTDADADGDDGGDFSGNLFPSPAPPGDLAPADAPQIIVFGFDDCMFTGDHPNDTAQASDNGMNFVLETFGPLTNPDGSDAHVSFYVNGCYMPNAEEGGPWGSETDYTTAAYDEWIAEGFELGNHTFDHLEINGTWGQIPDEWHDGSLGGWTDNAGTLMDVATWLDPVITFNDSFLVANTAATELFGLRAPRLEINDDGLEAAKQFGYLYDANLEEGFQWEYISAAVDPDAEGTGFKWVVWPHTLDNGSPGVWQAQDFGEKDYIERYPTGLWEIPVYMLYIPDNGLQETIADRMKAEITSEDTSWIGDKVREITSYDFNGFLYARLTREEFVEILKFNFLLRYNGNRAPLTFGAHPAEFSWRYDNEVVLGQPGNADYVDVLDYNTYQDRKDAIVEFLDWITDNFAGDVWFMSNQELVEYMQSPFDKDGNPVQPDALATPHNHSFFAAVGGWQVEKDGLGSDASFSVGDDGAMTIDFTVGQNDEGAGDYAWVDVACSFAKGALADVSHITLFYESDKPFRVRLVPDSAEGDTLALQALLAGGPGPRSARIRIKDFRPDPYADPDAIAAQGFADADYLAQVSGLAIENASPQDQVSYTVTISDSIFHGLDSGEL